VAFIHTGSHSFQTLDRKIAIHRVYQSAMKNARRVEVEMDFPPRPASVMLLNTHNESMRLMSNCHFPYLIGSAVSRAIRAILPAWLQITARERVV
jgi:hypothetical protein